MSVEPGDAYLKVERWKASASLGSPDTTLIFDFNPPRQADDAGPSLAVILIVGFCSTIGLIFLAIVIREIVRYAPAFQGLV